MSATNFKPSLALVLAHEGGYVNHPKDPGGATNKGVTQRVYDGYRRVNGLPLKPVKELTTGEAAAIYRQQYWRPIQADAMPLGLDYAVFDFAVNSGVARAAKFLQRCLGVEADGQIGMVTLGALERWQPERLIVELCEKRVAWLRELDTFATFGKGWLRRVEGLKSGVQPGADSGVVDYAVNMLRQAPALPIPKHIGALVNEPQTAKAA